MTSSDSLEKAVNRRTPIRCRLGIHNWQILSTETAGGFVKREMGECARCGEEYEMEYWKKFEGKYYDGYV